MVRSYESILEKHSSISYFIGLFKRAKTGI